MDLADLYRKQEEDKESFAATRQKVWDKMKEDHARVIAAFGNIDNLPDDMRGKIDRELENFSHEWASETGIKYQAMIDQHQRQFDALAGNSAEEERIPKSQPLNSDKPANDRAGTEKTKQQLIAEQRAMMAKRQKHRPKR